MPMEDPEKGLQFLASGLRLSRIQTGRERALQFERALLGGT
jgi:hypothetical protein